MTRMYFSGVFGVCIAALALAGCGTSAPVRYYGLVAVEQDIQFPVPKEFTVSVGPVRVAEYLNRSHIVTRGDGVGIYFAEYDRWPEPLAKSFQRTVANNLAALLGSDRVLEFPAQAELGVGYLLPAQVTRFDTDSTGIAILEIQWLVKNSDEEVVVTGRRSRYTGQVPDPDNYQSIVTALSGLIGAFSRDVGTILAELPQTSLPR